MKRSIKSYLVLIVLATVFLSCESNRDYQGTYNYEIFITQQHLHSGILTLEKNSKGYTGSMTSDIGVTIPLEIIETDGNSLVFDLEIQGKSRRIEGIFKDTGFTGKKMDKGPEITLTAKKHDFTQEPMQQKAVAYVLKDSDLQDYENDIDHQRMIHDFDKEATERGRLVYNATCINCHGIPEVEGSIPSSLQFWAQPFKYGNDPHAMYQTITKGAGLMPPQMALTPQEKYDVIAYIRENYVKTLNPSQYFEVNANYLTDLPEGKSTGPETKPYHPWSDMDYGNFLINTYELVDSETGPKRFHSPGPRPYPDENYLKNNFAYKGIAIRLDEGPGGVSKGDAWMIFDHDLMRVAGGWTGEGFIDWEGILLNGHHETYPRTIGKLHFETPVGPAWANPKTGSFEDPRFMARDGRRFGPLPREWTHFKGLYHSDKNIIISYDIGNTSVLERFGIQQSGKNTVFTRTMNIEPADRALQMRVAPVGTTVEIRGEGASLTNSQGFVVLNIRKGTSAKIKLFISQ